MSNLQPFRRLLPSSPLSLCMKWSSGVQRETCCCLLWPFGPATNGKTVKIANKHKNLCANCASTLNGYAQDENLWAGDILANLRSPNHQWLVRAVCTLYVHSMLHISHIPYYQLTRQCSSLKQGRGIRWWWQPLRLLLLLLLLGHILIPSFCPQWHFSTLLPPCLQMLLSGETGVRLGADIHTS